jgi:hypothetical protein
MAIPDSEHEDSTRVRRRLAAVLTVVAAALAAGVAGSHAAPLRPLRTAIVDPASFTGPDAAAALDRAVAAGATAIKVPLFWNEVAPVARPLGFQPSDPADPSYNWAALDTQLRLIHAHGLQTIVYIAGPPAWAYATIDGASRVDPSQYAAFVHAAVRRYSGATPGLPRVRLWQAWNEPNKVPGPTAKPGAADWYRSLVNAFAASAHTVPGNVVIAGGLAPLGISTSVAPLAFMRDMLCLSAGPDPRPTCSTKVHFDIWSIDPYTNGGPSHEPPHPDDVAIARLPEMKAVLDAAVAAGHVVHTLPVRFWVTEFSWDTNPPNPGGVPAALEGRWVAESLYRMWSAGVSLVTWFTLRDQPLATSAYQAGLYYLGPTFAGDRAKPAFTAFRFPFVAYPNGKRVTVWGRTPTSAPGPVLVEQRQASSWDVVGRLQANAVGIFSGLVAASGRGPLRARFPSAKEVSLAFSLVTPPDRSYQAFGAVRAGGSGPPTNAAVSQYVEPGSAGVLQAVLPAVGSRAPAVPSTAFGAALQAVRDASHARVLLLAAVLAGIALVLSVAAVARR